ncbi:hypothetical protein [uncultured Desulfovibrio sp.]|uniref:hypothetical protein n=1 Tax=uncultured Desulfovibrio sp. TaxID=167968 RepID=UPI002610355B|nr:hypothetical protein [uncultured Desulfovibrio sp.]
MERLLGICRPSARDRTDFPLMQCDGIRGKSKERQDTPPPSAGPGLPRPPAREQARHLDKRPLTGYISRTISR